MTDTARDDVAPITLSDHSRLLIASHRRCAPTADA